MSQRVELSIVDAHRLLVAGEVTSLELVEQTLGQIERTEPYVNAYVTLMVDTALEEARRADTELRQGRPRGPLHGIPIGVKDNCNTRGTLTEAGSNVLKGNRPSSDAAVVERLRDAGAVLVGKTVTNEFALGPAIQQTRNPWDQDRTPGGSSAGSGSAVAARSAFGAIGTDTAGSVRVPAGVNGVVGLKPTFGLISTWGVIPMAPSLDHVGLLTRTVADCGSMLGVLAGFDPRDPRSLKVETPDVYTGDGHRLEGIRVGIERTHLPDPAGDPAAIAAAEDVASTLTELGATLIEVEIPELDLADASLLAIKTAEASAYHLDRLDNDGPKYQRPTRVIIEAGALVPAVDYVRAQQARTLIRNAVRDTFRRHDLDALLGPGYGPAGLASENPTVPFSFSMRSSSVNLTGLPAINVPCGFTSEGLPLGGFELWGRPLGEAMIFRIAGAYESVHEWHRRLPPIASRTVAGPAGDRA